MNSPQKLVGAAYDRIFKTPLPKLSSKEPTIVHQQNPESPISHKTLLYVEGTKAEERKINMISEGSYQGIHS